MRFVVDSNKLQSSEFEEFLSESSSNFAVLPDYVSWEAYKADTLAGIFKALEIASKFPNQIIVLKDTPRVCKLSGRRKCLQKRLIDQEQTSRFSTFVRQLQLAMGGHGQYEREILKKKHSSDAHFLEMVEEAQDMKQAMVELGERFYTATTDKPTVVNLTNHAYFDLSAAGNVSDQVLWIDADTYTVAIPTGEFAPVAGTPLDFTTAASIGARAALIDTAQGQRQVFDHNFVINDGGSTLVKAAEVRDPASGRVMQVLTTQSGLQLFTGNPQGFCLETHHFPDSPNHPEFPSTTVRPGLPFASTTIYKFHR